MTIEEQIKTLKDIKYKTLYKSSVHKKQYIKLKKYDDYINIGTTFLNASAITLIVCFFTIPPCIIASGVLSGFSFILSSIQKTYNLKDRSESHRLSCYQYKDISREVNTTLLRNHMNSNEYQNFIEYINDKISIIEDSEI